MTIRGSKTVDYFHKKLGNIMWDYVGMGRNAEGLQKGLTLIKELEQEFWKDVQITGTADSMNPELEKAIRLADYFELAKLMAKDAYHRNESCGGHFREEYQTEDGETLRNDTDYMYVAAWEYQGHDQDEVLHKEPLVYQDIEIKQRNYK
jgi:succinate dehydrogenase / fumarate reductase flavoprotein subunit